MVNLIIKELSLASDEFIIVTRFHMKDMNGMSDAYRANAIRNLCRIIDETLLTQIKRYTRYSLATEIVKRWSNEVLSQGLHFYSFMHLLWLPKVGQSITLAGLSKVLAFAVGSFIYMPACLVLSMFAGSDDYDQTEEPEDYVEARDDV
nr:coatomer subunit gamma [Tanacetum cinerariifolium]